MANRDNAQGLVPAGVPLRQNSYVAGAAIYPGDPLTMNSSGLVVPAAAGDVLIGAAANAASGSGKAVQVWDHPDQQFVAQADDGTIAAQTDLGLNADIVAAQDSTYKVSRAQVDASTLAATSTLQLRVLRIEPAVGNALGSKVDVIVRINKHQLANNSAGV